jgi:hypothetical protein
VPIAVALATPKTGEREILVVLIDQNHRDAETAAILAERGARSQQPRIEWVDQTLEGELDLECRGGRTIEGVTARVPRHLPALSAAIWHNQHVGRPIPRFLTPYDHS